MTTIAPMRAEAYAVFLEDAIAVYAAENIGGGRWRAEEAQGLARAETERLLSHGIQTPDHYIFEVLDTPEGQSVGYVWFATLPRGMVKVAFVFQLRIKAEFQRQGHARAALSLVEQRARELALSGMALHVFAHNSGACALYRSVGYNVSSLNMIKPFLASDA